MATPPDFASIQKPTKDLLTKDFYHLTPVSLDLKTTAPNGVTFTSKGTVTPDKTTTALIEGKYNDKATGVTFTQGWTSANALLTKVDLADTLTPGLKTELVTSVVPGKSKSAKFNLYFAQQNVNARAFVDLLKGPVFSSDFTAGQDGFTAGGALSYDVKQAALTSFSAGLGYKAPTYSVSLVGSNSLAIYSAGYFQKVSDAIQVGAKGTYDSKGPAGGNAVAIEVGGKYNLDNTAFVKAKIADSGILALAYNQLLIPGVTIGLGGAFDTLKLGEAAHKLGLSLSFSA